MSAIGHKFAEGKKIFSKSKKDQDKIGRLIIEALKDEAQLIDIFNSVAEVLNDFITLNQKMYEKVESLVGVDLNNNKLPSPAFSLLKFRFGDVVNLDAKHTARHLYQIENIIQAQGFPQS